MARKSHGDRRVWREERAKALSDALRSALRKLAEDTTAVSAAHLLGTDRNALSKFLSGKRADLPGLDPRVLANLEDILPDGLASLSRGENLLRALQFSHRVTIVFASQPRMITSGQGRGEGRDYCSRWDLDAAAKLVNALNAPRLGAPRPEIHISHARQHDGTEHWQREIADNRQGSVVVLGSERMNVAGRAMLESFLFPGDGEPPFHFVWPSQQLPRGLSPGRFARTGSQRAVVFGDKQFVCDDRHDYAVICARRYKLRPLILVSGISGPGTFAGCQELGKGRAAQIAEDLTWIGVWEVPVRVSPGDTRGGDPRTLVSSRPAKLVHTATLRRAK